MSATPPAAGVTAPVRCEWAGADPLLTCYHDCEWGVPERGESRLFEMLTLEGAQAGLSWLTVLRRREGYRRAFAGFDIEAVAAYGARDIERLAADPGIIRSRAKIRSAVSNAGAALALREAGQGLSDRLWGLVGGSPVQNAWQAPSEVPARTELSEEMSGELKALGFSFVGPVICYSLMQACGMVNDHLVGCFRWAELSGATGSP